MLPFTITQIACGETFSLFLSNKNELIVSGMLELSESVFSGHRDELGIPHIVPFRGTILKIAAGTRFALVWTEIWYDSQLLVKGFHYNDVYYWKAEEGDTELAVLL